MGFSVEGKGIARECAAICKICSRNEWDFIVEAPFLRRQVVLTIPSYLLEYLQAQ